MSKSPDRLPILTRAAFGARRRGVVLVFVVAVLVLLAVIATTYLATARVDRVTNEVRGGPAGGGDDPLPLPLEELRLDVFNFTTSVDDPGGWRYRDADRTISANTYVNADYVDDRNPGGIAGGARIADDLNTSFAERQKYDPWLASRSPQPYDGAAFAPEGGPYPGNAYPAWPRISRWLERWEVGSPYFVFDTVAGTSPGNVGFFESPWSPSGTQAAPVQLTYRNRFAAVPTYIKITYPTTFISPATYAGQTAAYPALQFGGQVYLAADADGDGVADAGLFPLTDLKDKSGARIREDITLPSEFYGPLDLDQHETRWYAAVRIVDNSGNVNVNTAWRRDGDIKLNAGTPDTVGQTLSAPNYGFFRSNIGLYELLNLSGDAATQWTKFTSFRLGNRASGLVPEQIAGRTDYQLTTFAEAMEMNLGRRPLNPGSDAAGPYQAFNVGLAANLAYLGGLVNPRDSRNAVEDTLTYDAYRGVANWLAADDADRDKESRSFTHFAPPDDLTMPPTGSTQYPKLWWHSTHNPDDGTGGTRQTYFNSIGYSANPSAYGTGGPPPRSVRHLLTTSDPQTTSARLPGDPTVGGSQPLWLRDPSSNAPNYVAMEPFPLDCLPRVGINTGSFGALWRNFYLSMANPDNAVLKPADAVELRENGRVNAPRLPEVAASDVNLNPALQMRAALAAVNAMDMRDADDDITTKRIDLGPGLFVMVAGAEKQLFISHVEPGTVANTFTVTLANPYKRKINTKAYHLAFRSSIAEGGYELPLTTPPVLDVPEFGAPGGTAGPGTTTVDVPVPAGLAAGDLVLLRTRMADGTPTKSPPAEAAKNPYDEGTPGALNAQHLICVDTVRIGDFAAALAGPGQYDRNPTSWKIASAGPNYATGGVVDNPVALENLPTGVDPATGPTANRFPASGFARNGDMMMIPYAGHYAYYNGGLVTDTLLDSVPITWDVGNVLPVAASPQQVSGRFTPPPPPLVPAAVPPLGKSYSATWQSRIFDNFTALADPMTDATPNIALESWFKNGKQPPGLVKDNEPGLNDNLAPVHGLININTAPLKVLEMIPWVANGSTGMVDVPTSKIVAQKVLDYRRANGPFRSILDVLLIPNFESEGGIPTKLSGNFYTDQLSAMSVYAAAYNNFNRVSNLITTRSDSFTVYVVAQRWQDYGTTMPVLLKEIRSAYVIDRSQLRDGHLTEDFLRNDAVATD